MKKVFWLMVAVLSITAILLTFTRPDIIVGGLPKAHAAAYGMGQCARPDPPGGCSCPNPTDNLQGYGQDGTPICSPEPTGCPYGEHIPLGPECDKAAPKLAPNGDLTTTPTNPVPEPVIDDGFVGK